ncbi:MAG: hypothetical protein HY874_11225 [Chloroflexi bacterium]|nr:hypothetical protein [Chloroflexota bacterium]
MLRITTWRMTGTPPQGTTPQVAFQAIQDMCNKLEKIPGTGRLRWYIGNQGVVTVGEPESYAVADAILKSKEAQAAIGKVFALGYSIAEDQFLLELSQVTPFTQAASQVPAELARV